MSTTSNNELKKSVLYMDLFQEELEQIAIERIRKFAKIAQTMGFEVRLGFSGGKDSLVCYDLCKRSGIAFRTFFNHSFESSITLRFIREHYPDVIWRRNHPLGFIQNIRVNHKGFLPSVQSAYCCEDYKHNPKNVDDCSIVGVRKVESAKRKKRTAFETRNKTTMKRNKALFNNYFEEHCQSTGTSGIIQLKPIIDWTDDNVWSYIKMHNLPVNPEYKKYRRIGCMVCPKANFTSNYIHLIEFPKLIDAFIMARDKAEREMPCDWSISLDNKDYTNDKPYYICRWLNHSFCSFTKKQEKLYEEVRKRYNESHKQIEDGQKTDRKGGK